MVRGVKVYPGIKDLPIHIRQNFRNEFIRFIFKQIANSTSPWTNPDVDALQSSYEVVYPTFPHAFGPTCQGHSTLDAPSELKTRKSS